MKQWTIERDPDCPKGYAYGINKTYLQQKGLLMPHATPQVRHRVKRWFWPLLTLTTIYGLFVGGNFLYYCSLPSSKPNAPIVNNDGSQYILLGGGDSPRGYIATLHYEWGSPDAKYSTWNKLPFWKFLQSIY